MPNRQSPPPDTDLKPNLGPFFSLSSDYHATITPDGLFQYVSPAWVQSSGFAREELSGSPVLEFIHGDDLEATRLELKRLATATALHRFEARFRCKDGSFRILAWSALSVPSEQLLYASARDITEQRRKERRLAAQYAVARVLSEAESFDDAIADILPAIGKTLEWLLGVLWTVDYEARLLRCGRIWTSPGVQVAEFEAVTGVMTFPPSIGLPGRVWASRAPAWISDILKDNNFPRMPFASSSGLHGAFAFPVMCGGEVTGVVEFFSRDVQQLDDDLLRMMGATGFQIGQFLARKRAEAEQERLIHQLQEALANVKTLSGLLPICSSCKKIRDDKGYWNRLEDYILAHSEAHITHGLCTECARKIHPDWDQTP